MPELVEYRFVVQGNPVPWTVWTRKSEPPSAFLEMQAWQQQIMAQVRHQWGARPRIRGQVALEVDFYLRWPKTAPQRHAGAIARWRDEHLAMKPDGTNLFKACEDAVAAVLFETGDQQVVQSRMSKGFAGLKQKGYSEIVVKVLA